MTNQISNLPAVASAKAGPQSAIGKSAPRLRSGLRNPPRHSRAFTLVEVILAVGLTMGIVLAALAFYQQIISTRQAFGDRLGAVEVTAGRRALMERMTDELRSAIVYPFLQMGLTGDAMGMQFMVAGLPGQGVWATDDNSDRPPVPQQDMRIVGYRLRQSEDPYTGQPVIDGIERTEQTVIAATTIEEGVNVTATLIGPSFKFLSLRYWDGQSGQWLTSWDGGDAPMAVEIVIGIEPLPEGMEPVDYPFEAFRRVVHVQAGKRSLGGTTIMRGLGSLPRHSTGAGGAVQ